MAKTLIAIYTRGKGITGQLVATRLLVDALKKEGWSVHDYPLPALDRDSPHPWFAYFIYFLKLLLAWMRLPYFLLLRPDFIHLNAGQSLVALIRDWVPFQSLVRLTRARGYISMHGSIAMSWRKQDRCTQLLNRLTRSAEAVTVLGTQLQQQLIHLGVPEGKIVILPNTCDIPPLSENSIRAKQSVPDTHRILFISNLIDAKGYPEFLEGMELLARQTTLPLEINLCGQLYQTEYSDRFKTVNDARQWIEQKLQTLNSLPHASARWLEGVAGEEKEHLLHAAHLFVFPSRYPVEAQPIVLLEAMASGAAIITSSIGEIPETVGKCALLLQEVSGQTVYHATRRLLENGQVRLDYAQRGAELFHQLYSQKQYKQNWLHLLS